MVLLASAAPVGAGWGAVAATPVGASGSTLYMAVTNVSLDPTTAKLNVSLTSGSTTLVGSTSVSVQPMSTVVVPVSMSGQVSKLSLSLGVKVSIVQDADCPF